MALTLPKFPYIPYCPRLVAIASLNKPCYILKIKAPMPDGIHQVYPHLTMLGGNQSEDTMSKADQHAAYNQGYVDAINARPANPNQTTPDLTFYYHTGHAEGWPKRLIPTTIMTPRGPITERCSLERALYLAATNVHTTTKRT